jgi:hypothetical protein
VETAEGAAASAAAGGTPAAAAISTAWDENDLASDIKAAGFSSIECRLRYFDETRVITKKQLDSWFSPESVYGAVIADHLSEKEVKTISRGLERELSEKQVTWRKAIAFVTAKRPL